MTDQVVELLEDYYYNADEQDVYKVAAELRQIIGEELAEIRRKEDCARLGY